MRILIVDDEDAIREIIVEVFRDLFSEVCEAANGYEALKHIKDKPFDLVISDYHMPKMSGLDLLRICREENIRVPMIWLSGRDNPELRTYAWQYGLFDYLEKPFDIEKLRESVQSFLTLDPKIKQELFLDYTSPALQIPFENVSKKITKVTYRTFIDWCLAQNEPMNEIISKLLV